MLTAEERYSIWEEFHKRVRELFIDVEDALSSKFEPYRFEDGKLVEADKDTPKVKKLFDLLADLDAFVEGNYKRAYSEYCKWENEQYNVQRCFDAWSAGLCPEALKDIPNMQEFGEGYAYDTIAKLKQSSGISKEDTAKAVELWKVHRRLGSMACAS